MFLPVTAARSPVSWASLPTEISRFFNDAFVHPLLTIRSVFFFWKRIKEVRSEVLLVINNELQPCGMRRRTGWQKGKVKCTFVQVLRLCTGRTAHTGSRGIALFFLDHGTRRGEGSASRPGRSLSPGKTRYSLYRRLGGPQGRSGQVRKISPSPGFDPRTVQPVASLYTDWAIRPTVQSGRLRNIRWHLLGTFQSWRGWTL